MNNILSLLENNASIWIILSVVLFVVIYFLIRPLIDDFRCKRSIQKNSKTFYKAFSQLKEKKKRKAIYAVYTFCRIADDLVDEHRDLEGIHRLERELELYITKDIRKSYMWRSLYRHTKPFYDKFDYKPFKDMIKGQKMDLDFRGYETTEDLLMYCYHVASTVGLMLTPILAYENQDSLKDFSINLGYAMQITNILRDIGEDYKKGRVYIPRKAMEEANYSLSDLISGRINKEFISMFEKLALIAETNFDNALKDCVLFPMDARVPLSLAILLYKEIINVIRENGYDVFTKRAITSSERKKEIIESFLKTI